MLVSALVGKIKTNAGSRKGNSREQYSYCRKGADAQAL
jgi:hypothetical protein